MIQNIADMANMENTHPPVSFNIHPTRFMKLIRDIQLTRNTMRTVSTRRTKATADMENTESIKVIMRLWWLTSAAGFSYRSF